MTPIRLIFAACLLALAPLVSQAQSTQVELSEELFTAAHLGYMPIVRNLVEQGANVNYISADRTSPMHAAASRGYLDVIQYLRSRGAYLNPRTVEDWIPLHHAVRFGHREVVNYLLASGAPLYMRTRSGQTVFDMAQGTGDFAMLNLLERYR
jgi:ankyrin repeat protein